MNVQIQPLAEITSRARNALIQEMGVVDTLRFLNQFRVGSCPGTKERDGLGQNIISGNRYATGHEKVSIKGTDIGMSPIITMRYGQPTPGIEKDFGGSSHRGCSPRRYCS